MLSKNTHFGSIDDSQEESYYLIYLNSVSTLLLTLFYKLETKFILEDDFYDLQKFSQIIEHYQKNCTHAQGEDYISLIDFKHCLLNNYAYIHNKTNNNSQVIHFSGIVEKLIKNKNLTSENLNMTRNIILYSNEIDEIILIKTIKTFLEIPKIKNDYFEFFKLNIIDIIIRKFTNSNSEFLKEKHLNSIFGYVEKNKVASHLMAMYSKIHLTLSLYYSYKFDLDSQNKSKDLYYGYIHINGYELLNNEYKDINEKILMNYGKMQIDDLDIDELNLKKEKYFEIGQKISNNYNKFKEINLKYEINQNLSNIITHIFNNDGLDNDTLNHEIEYFISQKIFYGLVFSSVEGLCERECRIDDVGYEKISIDLMSGYKLRFAYSNVYKHTFEQIYSKNKQFIKQNVINILISYIKSIPMYLDTITNLNNKNKLEKDLLFRSDEDFIFIEIYLDSLVKINEQITFNKANKYFRSIATALNSIANTYRTYGPRLGILLDSSSDYKSIVEQVKNLSVDSKDENIKFACTIAVSWGNHENIIEKSHHALLLASNNKEKYHEFK